MKQVKQITILSGKGGTGKTTLTAAFAALAEDAVIADCDVDAPDLHMLLHPKIIEKQEFKGSKLAVINENKCIKCGLCREKCRFDAITEDLKIDPFSCEGCGVCAIVCPVNAITLTEQISGYAYISKTKFGFMVHAMLNPGEANSGKLVTLVKQNAKTLAENEDIPLIIVDGPPGIGCPVIASIADVDVGLVISEPTMSGIHDLKRVILLLKHFNIPSLVCINMYDINRDNTQKILEFCRENDIEVVGKIPFDSKVVEAMINGKTIVEFSPESNVTEEIRKIWEKLCNVLNLTGNC